MRRWVAMLVIAAAPSALVAATPIPAFPGAEGFGASTPGGRGGQILEVTTLADEGPGSFRAAVDTHGPRVIVFRVGGTIELNSPLQVRHPFVTVAGQSAPGGGITLKNGPKNLFAPLQIKTHDVVIRYLRSRPGRLTARETSTETVIRMSKSFLIAAIHEKNISVKL